MRRRYVNVASERQRDGSRLVRHYFRPPKGKALPDGIGNRLPDDPEEASARALELAASCIPFRMSPKGQFLIGRIEELALDTLRSAKRRANTKGHEFTLTEADVQALLVKQDFRCAVSGLEFRVTSGEQEGASRSPYRPSIDRIRCDQGYTPDNVRIVLVAVNVALSDWGDDVVIAVARAIAARHPRQCE